MPMNDARVDLVYYMSLVGLFSAPQVPPQN